MKDVADNDELLTRYLLGDLGGEEQEEVEQRYISDPAFYEQLLAVEDELIDSYAEGALSQKQRASFESHFMRSPERQTRVGFAEAWMTYLSRRSTAVAVPAAKEKKPLFEFLSPAAWPLALRVAAAALLLIVGGWLSVEVVRLRSQIQQAELQRAALQKEKEDLERQIDEERNRSLELTAQLDQQTTRKSDQPNQIGHDIVSFFLTPGLVRGTGDAKRNIIPTDAKQVNLELGFNDNQYERYDVVITSVGGPEIWRKDAGKPQSRPGGKSMRVQVPAALFKTNDYIVNVIGTDSSDKVARYVFSVVRK